MMARRDWTRGLSLVEVALAVAILSLLIVFLVGWINILPRRTVVSVDLRAKANALATRYLEDQRAKVRASSFADLLGKPERPVREPVVVVNEMINVDGIPYAVRVTLTPGSVKTGAFVATVPVDPPSLGGVPQDPPGSVAPYAAARVTVTVSWSGGSITRETIIVPR